MKKVIAVILTLALLAAICAVQTGALTEEEANAGYYLVGSMNNWSVSSAYHFSLNPADAGEYMIAGCALTTADEFKVIYSHDGKTIDEYFPMGFDNNCTLGKMGIDANSVVDIFFRPDMDGADDWYFGCIYLELKSVKPTENTDPTEINGQIDGGYYLVFKSDSNRIRERNRLYGGNDRWWIHGVTLCTSDKVKIAYSLDCKTVSCLYPEGEDDYYVPQYNSRYYTVEFALLGDGEGDEWYEGVIKAFPCDPPVEDPTEYVPVTNRQMKQNRYEDAFKAAYPNWNENDSSYEEIYYHRNMFECDDWTLVKTTSSEPIDGGGYGVFDEIAVFASESYPFTLGFGVLDHRDRTFYSIGQAWNMDFEDLHDVFVHIAPQYADTAVLGDADLDGELTIIDVTHIQRCLANMEELDDEWMFEHTSVEFGPQMTCLSDFDCDGQRTILDATLIQRQLVGISKYRHDFTASVKLEKDGDTVKAAARASFGTEPVQYKFTIEGSVHAYTVYGSDWGRFNAYDEDYEPMPGNEHMTTGWIADSSVELPLKGITYNEDYTLTVTAKDTGGKISQTTVLYFKNVY